MAARVSLDFAEDIRGETIAGQFILDLDGFDGPIDLLLQLARDKKIDLTQLSITALADQYIAFIDRARHLRLEIAADYLVMAAWLAFLKSRLLLPSIAGSDEDEPTPEELAQALAFQLRRLDAMRKAGEQLARRPQRGSDFLARGAPETFTARGTVPVDLSLYNLLDAYSACRRKSEPQSLYQIPPLTLDSIENALDRLSGILGRLPDWSVLSNFLPHGKTSPLHSRAHLAATFGASLELVKRGTLALRQEKPFAPIFVRGANKEATRDG